MYLNIWRIMTDKQKKKWIENNILKFGGIGNGKEKYISEINGTKKSPNSKYLKFANLLCPLFLSSNL